MSGIKIPLVEILWSVSVHIYYGKDTSWVSKLLINIGSYA